MSWRSILGLITFSCMGVLGLTMTPALSAQRAASSSPSAIMLSGTVHSASGEAMEGVAVSVRAADKTFTTTVFTRKDGSYTFPSLDAGQYRILAQAVGYEAGRAEARLEPDGKHRQAFKLNTFKDFSMQLNGAEWIAALPDDTQEHRRLKQIFQTTCTACHGAHVVLRQRFDEAGWRAIINLMSFQSADGGFRTGGQPQPILAHYRDELAAYLAEMRGPGPSPMKFVPLPRPTGEATRVVITEYDAVLPQETLDPRIGYGLREWADGAPSNFQAGGPHDVVADHFGNAWATDPTANSSRSYVKIDTKTGKVTDFKVDAPGGVMARGSHGLGVVGADGMVWLNLEAGSRGDPEARSAEEDEGRGGLGRIDPKTGKLEIFTPPAGMPSAGGHLEPDGTGKIWSGTNRGLLQLDPETKQFKEFKSLFIASNRGTSTYGAAGDMDGNGWLSIISHDTLMVADPKTGTVKEFTLPPNKAGMDVATAADREFFAKFPGQTTFGNNAAAPWAQTPRRIGPDLKAPVLWVCNWNGQSLAEVDIRTHNVTFYPAPIPQSGVYDVDVDDNHRPWVSLRNADRVGRLDPKTKQWTVYTLPTLGTEARHISVDHKTGDVWVPGRRSGTVVRLHFLTEQGR